MLYLIVSYRIISYCIISYHIVSYHIISYHIISCCIKCTSVYRQGAPCHTSACIICTLAMVAGFLWPVLLPWFVGRLAIRWALVCLITCIFAVSQVWVLPHLCLPLLLLETRTYSLPILGVDAGVTRALCLQTPGHRHAFHRQLQPTADRPQQQFHGAGPSQEPA